MFRQVSRHLVLLLSAVLTLGPTLWLAAPAALPSSAVRAATGTYHNPLTPTTTIGDDVVESCADPSVISAPNYEYEGSQVTWYMYCTSDPLNDSDKNAAGDFNFRLIPMLSSTDLINWTHRGEAFSTRPSYAAAGAGIWAPEIEFNNGQYYLYYTVTDTTLEGGGSAIGVATGPSPLGPWTHSTAPAVEPHRADCCDPSRRNVFDPEVIQTPVGDFIYYGSYFGGVSVRQLSADGLTSVAATQKNVGIANKYEGPEVVRRGDFYYLMMSATDCCRGPLTGYSVFVGRSASPLGPFVDRAGKDLNDNEPLTDVGAPPPPPVPSTLETNGRAGGSVFLSMSGNRWVGPGHHTVFDDFDGQSWTIYHAIDRNDPYFAGGVDLFGGNCGAEGRPDSEQPCGDLNKRPALLDPVDWTSDGWPIVRNGHYVSDQTMPAPAAQPGTTTAYTTPPAPQLVLGAQIDSLSDEFDYGALSSQWTWFREPTDPGRYAEEAFPGTDGVFRFRLQNADLFVNSNNASVLTEAAPDGDYVVETKVRMETPDEGCCFNFDQAGVVVYKDDDNFVKLVHASIFNTRQTEWAKELAPVPQGFPRYGNSIVGPPEGPSNPPPEDPTQDPPGEWTYLRIERRVVADQDGTYGGNQQYTAHTSIDGELWERGGTWTHRLGDDARIGLVSMGVTDFLSNPDRVVQAQFDYVRVYALGTGYEEEEDTVAPLVTAPAQGLRVNTTVGSSSVPITVKWSGSDRDSGIAAFDLERRTTTVTYGDVRLPTPTATAVSNSLRFGSQYRYRVAATDGAGNESNLRYGPLFTPRLVQDSASAVRYSSSWRRGSSTSASGGTVMHSSVRNARATFTFTGRNVAWVAPRSAGRGSAKVYLNGVYQGTVSLYSASPQTRRVVYTRSWSTSATRTLTIVVAGTAGHPRVDVDAFVVLR